MTGTGNRRVLVTTRFFDDEAIAFLKQNGCEVVTSGLRYDQMDTELSPGQLIALLDGVDGWIVGTVAVTRAVIEAAPTVRVIARRGVGYDNVDIEAARQLGRIVTIAAGGNDASVADHAVAMMLALAKRLRESHERLVGGNWNPLSGADLYRKTVGLVGLGRIARAVARRVQGFDAEILAYDTMPDRDYAAAQGIALVPLAEVLARSDFVSLHLPLVRDAGYLIGAAELAAMKPGAILINTARGGLVDEVALLAALEAGRLGGAGLDVFEHESDPARRDVADALLRRPNVVATAHAAGSSQEGLARTNLIAAQTVLDVLDGKTPEARCVVVDGTASR